MEKSLWTEKLRIASRWILASAMVWIGVRHFTHPAPFVSIVPSYLPAPEILVAASGFFEVAGGVGLLVPRVRSAAGWGLVALYLAVFPANVNMAVHHLPLDGEQVADWILWIRLPFQGVFMAWAWWCSRKSRIHPAPRPL